MAFITESNLNRIIVRCDLKNIEFNCPVYEKMDIYMFSPFERKILQAFQELLQDPDKYIKYYYHPIEKRMDTQKYIYEGGSTPSYHESRECESLRSSYTNYEIPEIIKEKGVEEINKFREWFKQNEELLNTKPDFFENRLFIRWGIRTNIKAINLINSGITEFQNYTIEELESEIDNIIRNSAKFYKSSTKNTIILRRYSKLTYLAYKEDFEPDSDLGYEREEIIELLKEYHEQFKKPLKEKLIEYYRLRYNPNIEMQGNLLENLGFKPCFRCSSDI